MVLCSGFLSLFGVGWLSSYSIVVCLIDLKKTNKQKEQSNISRLTHCRVTSESLKNLFRKEINSDTPLNEQKFTFCIVGNRLVS